MDKEKLITAVFIREPLWNKRNQFHHNCIVLNKLWKQIAEEFKVSDKIVKSQWKRLRQTFIKKLSEQPAKKSGDGADDGNWKSDWPYFEALLFLKDTCTPRASEGNFSVEDEVQSGSDDENSSQAPSSAPETTVFSEPSSPLSPKTPVRKKTKSQKHDVGEALVKAEQEKIEYLKRKEERSLLKKEKDEDEQFFYSILPHVRNLDPMKKMKLRIDILQLVHDAMRSSKPSVPHRVDQQLPSTSYQNMQQQTQPASYEQDQNQLCNSPQESPTYFSSMYPNTHFGN